MYRTGCRERLWQCLTAVRICLRIGERDVKVFIGGTVLRLKEWKFEEGRYYFGVRFLPGKSILPDGLSIQDVVNTDLEIDRNEYGQHLTDSLAEAAGNPGPGGDPVSLS